jgi:hypothetical protein
MNASESRSLSKTLGPYIIFFIFVALWGYFSKAFIPNVIFISPEKKSFIGNIILSIASLSAIGYELISLKSFISGSIADRFYFFFTAILFLILTIFFAISAATLA